MHLEFSAGAETFRVLTGGRQLDGPYCFCSLTLKGLERRIDGLLEPDGHPGPVDVPGYPSWAHQSDVPLLSVSLRGTLPDWVEREPDNPSVAVFAPLLIDDDAQLRIRAPHLWRTVQTAPLADAVRDILSQLLEFWFFERFRGLTAKEIWAMLNLVNPLQETKAYQSIFAEGQLEGQREGKREGRREGKADDLKRLLTRRFGAVPVWALQHIDAASIEQLDTWLDGIFDAPSLDALIIPEPD